MLIDWTSDFDRFLDRIEQEGGQRLDILTALLSVLQELDEPPSTESASLRRVRQSQRYPLWRVAHPFTRGIALRLVVWFAPDGTVVVVATAFDKAAIGDVWYASAVKTADAVIDRWQREKEQ